MVCGQREIEVQVGGELVEGVVEFVVGGVGGGEQVGGGFEHELAGHRGALGLSFELGDVDAAGREGRGEVADDAGTVEAQEFEPVGPGV